MTRTPLLFAALFIVASFLAPLASGLPYHSADTGKDFNISLSELLRVIQFFNSNGYHCEQGTEDNFAPGPGDTTCAPHNSDYNSQDWIINLSELLRLIQMYNGTGYGLDPKSEDGFNPLFTPVQDNSTPGQIAILIGLLRGMDDGDVPPADKDPLKLDLDNALNDLEGGDVCGAADALDLFLAGAQNVRLAAPGPGSVADAERLFALASRLQYDTLTTQGTGFCPTHPGAGGKADVTVDEAHSDTTGMSASVDFGDPILIPVTPPDDPNHQTYTQLEIPGTFLQSGEPGTPGIPSIRKLVALPPDSFQVGVQYVPGDGSVFKANIYPFQEQPADQTQQDLQKPPFAFFANHAFVKNESIYGADSLWPPSPVVVTPIGMFRGLAIAQVEVFAGQFNPVTGDVTMFNHVDFQITFGGQARGFLPETAGNPFESAPSVYTDAVMNSTAVKAAAYLPVIAPNAFGEEFIILAHPDFIAAANALRDWKNAKGIVTSVFACGTGSGITGRETAPEIDAFLEDHYNNTQIKATYVLLLGDAEFIPTFTEARAGSTTGETIGSDWQYAWVTGSGGFLFDGVFPTFALGRIPVDTLDQANTVVNKIISYEKTPPGTIFADSFYSNATFAGLFQCCREDVANNGTDERTFIEAAEFVRPQMIAHGYNVDRIYKETVDPGCTACDNPYPAYTADATPRRYYDGTLIPAGIAPGSGLPWDGDTSNVVNAFNAGRFLIFHRDHGWHSGWGDPPFNTFDISTSLSNGSLLPVVFSINCSSGLFDNETSPGAEGSTPDGTYFSEWLLRLATGGAVGVIGDTRYSPSWPNTALAKGLFDAIWPDTLTDFGGSVSHRRLGDILNHAKTYLVTQEILGQGGVSSNDLHNELRLYHCFGDPTLEIWLHDPNVLNLSTVFTLDHFGQGDLGIGYANNGAILTVLQDQGNGPVPIGRGQVLDNVAQIKLLADPDRVNPLIVSASMDDAVSVQGQAPIGAK